MAFNSLTFVIFFAIVYALYLMLRHREQNTLLLVASYVFYGWWDWRFLVLLAISTSWDYWLGGKIEASGDMRWKKRWLLLSITGNLGLLGFFKYFNFFIDSTAAALEAFGFTPHLSTLNIILPAGISFYTFQSMSYVIDLYRGVIAPARSFWHFALCADLLSPPRRRPDPASRYAVAAGRSAAPRQNGGLPVGTAIDPYRLIQKGGGC